MSRKTLRALLIFTRNPEPGKCKTRLAAAIGDRAALNIYRFLLRHTAAISRKLRGIDKHVYFSDHPGDGSFWDPDTFQHHLQKGEDLGARMHQAFLEAFAMGYSQVVLIGSDLYNLTTEDLTASFRELDRHEVVLGPAADGGYYLIGMKRPIPGLFRGKHWGTETVLKDSLVDLKDFSTYMLPERNDVDRYEDIEGNPIFKPFLNQKES
ncbi:MAG: TIGR04282 family arsenosugar biosynthesis glycosyltransferase [Robiginitalea sp.]